MALIIGLALGGCGFQLRGAFALPAEYGPVHVQPGGALATALVERLRGADLRLTEEPAQAGLVLRVLSERRDARVMAVDRAGKALAYELSFQARFDALGADGRVLLAAQQLRATRVFDDNPDVAVLGKRLESEIIHQDLVADLADRILLRLRASLAPS